MKFTVFLQEQLNSFVDCYKKYSRQTVGITISFTIICFVCAALLLRLSDFDGSIQLRQISLLSYFFNRYSDGKTYAVVDLAKTVFIFFVALFSITLMHAVKNKTGQQELTFRHSFRALRMDDVITLIVVLLIAAVADYALFEAETYFSTGTASFNVYRYMRSTCFHLRIYVPLILFSIALWRISAGNKSRLTFKRILFLYIALWLFNEVAYEFFEWMRIHVFGLILMPVKEPESYYLFESILGVPLVASLFLGYYAAMLMPLIITEPTHIEDAGEPAAPVATTNNY